MREIKTLAAPSAIGTYSQAIQTGDFVFISGQIPLVPETMTLCGDDFREQAEQVFKNLSAVCEASGGTLARIVKLNIYLTHLEHFPIVNEVMSEYFKPPYPARAVVGISALPKEALVEVEAVLSLAE